MIVELEHRILGKDYGTTCTFDCSVLEVVVEHDVETQTEGHDEEDVPNQEEEEGRQNLDGEIITSFKLIKGNIQFTFTETTSSECGN